MQEAISNRHEDAKEKVMFPEIVVRGTKDKPYYEIKYYDVTDKQWHLGYVSYNLEYVMQWKEERLEVVEGSITNELCEKIKERLRNIDPQEMMSEEQRNVLNYCIEIVNQVAEEYCKHKLTPEQRDACWAHSSKDCSKCGQCYVPDINVGSNDGWIPVPKEAFDRMIARMESESERDIYEEESLFINVRDAARIVREIAREYKHGHYGCNWNGQHEKCKDCGLRGECSHYNTEWFAEYSNSEIPNMSDVPDKNVGEIDEVCEWKRDNDEFDIYDTKCKNRHVFFEGSPIDNEYEYCPYCGKEIKVVK